MSELDNATEVRTSQLKPQMEAWQPELLEAPQGPNEHGNTDSRVAESAWVDLSSQIILRQFPVKNSNMTIRDRLQELKKFVFQAAELGELPATSSTQNNTNNNIRRAMRDIMVYEQVGEMNQQYKELIEHVYEHSPNNKGWGLSFALVACLGATKSSKLTRLKDLKDHIVNRAGELHDPILDTLATRYKWPSKIGNDNLGAISKISDSD